MLQFQHATNLFTRCAHTFFRQVPTRESTKKNPARILTVTATSSSTRMSAEYTQASSALLRAMFEPKNRASRQFDDLSSGREHCTVWNQLWKRGLNEPRHTLTRLFCTVLGGVGERRPEMQSVNGGASVVRPIRETQQTPAGMQPALSAENRRGSFWPASF